MRLDAALVARGLVSSRTRARALITAGRVRVDGSVVTKASHEVDSLRELMADDEPWVSRAAHKLLGALDESGTVVSGRALDAGASTGGFTQVLVERGCSRVYAVDVGHGQLHPVLAQDPRVCPREGLNLRDLTLDDLDGQRVDTLVADVSFISLTLLMAPMLAVVDRGGVVVVLVKPQFEVGRAALGKGGIVRDPELRAAAVADVCAAANAVGWLPAWSGASRLAGEHGNTETAVVFRHESHPAVRAAERAAPPM